MRLPYHGAILLILIAVGAAGSAACDLQANLTDLGDTLLDPDAALIDAPGRKLASGHYSRLELDGSLETGGWVLARRHDVDPEALAIVSFIGDGSCEVAPMQKFERVSSRIDVALPGLVAVQQSADEQGMGRVSFVGFDCKERLEALPNAGLPSVLFPRSAPRGLLTLTNESQLVLVDAVAGKVVDVASQVDVGRTESSYLWTLEQGEAVVYASTLVETARFGQGVRELVVLGGSKAPSAAYVDDTGLHLATVADGSTELVAEDACAPASLGSQVIAYFSPCAERRLRLSVPGTLLQKEEERVDVEIASEVSSHAQALPFWQGKDSMLLYLTNSDANADDGTLHVVRLLEPDAAEAIEEDVSLRGGAIYVDWNGRSGRLVTPRYRSTNGRSEFVELQSVAERVAQVPGGSPTSSRGVLANFDGETGDLLDVDIVDGQYASTVIAERVPVQNQAASPDGDIAFVGDFDGSSGSVYLIRKDEAPRVVAQKAIVGTLRFLEQPKAVAFLAQSSEPGEALLRAWLLEAQLELQISEGVSEYRELPWPSPGLLYAIPGGERAGIWFAKAR